jgi:LysM repeat protein
MTKKIYLKSPVKLVRSILILLGVVVVTMFVATSPSYSKITPQYELVTVAQGDTLWSIASKYNVSINDIRMVNNLNSDILSIGQTLMIP